MIVCFIEGFYIPIYNYLCTYIYFKLPLMKMDKRRMLYKSQFLMTVWSSSFITCSVKDYVYNIPNCDIFLGIKFYYCLWSWIYFFNPPPFRERVIFYFKFHPSNYFLAGIILTVKYCFTNLVHDRCHIINSSWFANVSCSYGHSIENQKQIFGRQIWCDIWLLYSL